MNRIKVIVIDSKNKEIREAEIVPTLKEFYAIIGCELVEPVYPPSLHGDFIYVDEEGALKENTQFKLGWDKETIHNHATLKGNAIVLSFNSEGDEESCTSTIDRIKELVTFI